MPLLASGNARAQHWVAAWGVAQGAQLAAPAMSGTSVRMIVRPTLSGDSVRVRIENTLGKSPVVFSRAYIGRVQSGATLVPGSGVALSFQGQAGITLAPGAGAYSDPVPFTVAAFQRYAISLDVQSAADISAHMLGLVTNYMATGAHAADEGGASFVPVPSNDTAVTGPTFPFYWVAGLEVAAPAAAGAVVAFGDSITDGECSTRTSNGALAGVVQPDLYNRWTDLLAGRLAAAPGAGPLAVVDEGIAGNRVVSGGSGPPAVERMSRDVLGRGGVARVIFLEGTNDIANGATAAALVQGDLQIIDMAHAAGLEIVGATIIPRGGSNGWTAAMEQQRLLLNAWIRTQANFDGVIDFDALLQGPANAATGAVTIAPQWSCFDGVHPNSAGYAAMAGAIGLDLLQPATGPAPPVSLTYVAGSSAKVEQMIGDCDYAIKASTGSCSPTASRTVTRFNILGNDLGQSFEAGGKVVFLFGDTISSDASAVNYHAHDPIAWSATADPASGLLLNFYTNADGSPLFVVPPGVPTGADDVPNAGISLPDGIYLTYASGSDTSLADPHANDYSVLVKFDPVAQTFTTGRAISRMPGGRFITTALHASGTDVLMFGLGNYRASDVYLATTPAGSFASGAGTQYFAGLVNGQPTWTPAESGAVPVVQDNPLNGPAWSNDSPTIGNVSVAYSGPLKLWLMTYDGGRQSPKTSGVYFSYAQAPWGPWSKPQLIYSPTREPGLGVFIHDPSLPAPGDGLTGPTIGGNDPVATRGGAYAPFMIERFNTITGNTLRIHYTLSTWNPYTIVMMRTDLQIAPASGGVVEFYEPDLDDYFITADPAEQASVDSGAVGRWLRTGNVFAAGGPSQVCRFYGNSNINPATHAMYGPNSHFYTADPAECAGLKAQYTPTAKSWKFESNDFLTTPAVNGGCAAGMVPVYRAYNNGFARGIDSNHRITSNYAAYQQTVAAGWIGEGVVMCAP